MLKLTFPLIALIMLVGCSANPYDVQQPPDRTVRTVKFKWSGDIHKKIIKDRQCWDDYCQTTKRTVYLNRDWPDDVRVMN